MAQSSASLTPFEVLIERTEGVPVALPETLAALYGRLAFPDLAAGNAWVISNLVASIDGVVAFGDPASDPIPRALREISASDPHDRALMGLLRAVADAVVVGSNTLRAIPRHLWRPSAIAPAYGAEWATLRATQGKSPDPLAVIVSQSGAVDTSLPVFQQAHIPALLVTSSAGAARLSAASLGPQAHIQAVETAEDGALSASVTLASVRAALAAREPQAARAWLILVEGGPRLLGQFAAEGLLNEQFLTIAPQFVGRDEQARRSGLIEGQRLVPERPTWAKLVSARAAGDYLFMRYRLTEPAK